MPAKLSTYNPAEDLASDSAIANYPGDTYRNWRRRLYPARARRDAHAQGVAQIASQTGLSPEQLDPSFSEIENSALKTRIAVMKALGIELLAKIAT